MNNTPLTYTAGAQDENTFLRDLLASKLLLSHSLVVRLKHQNKIQVNGQLVHTNYRLQAGDFVTINIDLSEENNIIPESIPLDIVYEDEDFVAVNKPAGMSIHPSRLGGTGTLANAVTYHWQGLGRNILFRPINRLDKDTSGLVLIGKSQFAHQGIFNQLKQHKIDRRYIALVERALTRDHGHIDQPIARPDANKRRRIVHPAGQAATTHYQVLDRYPDHTLLSLKLETGRTHQIRVHLSYIGHPVSGDLLYGFASPLIKRQALHADRIRFTHPRSGKEVILDIPLAQDMQTAVDYLGNQSINR
ncbi:pseudouridine synthase, RluA family [Syntrophobotulus glycolicus DSM 8271]|uniref:Pseudouridine synthase n=1 Tax=Syntrophobotulus glycolicus (strain DSM 8271 / FlGlyR) TaxID=645991 RepID=F0SU20_SYNGF|nr:RluA family pseudouridine synthase [Syntrophobotulus glycolicus]ADY55403.1 pseudouridine synthase, RluA family [Syntrophobotulus glycolicus DSM 8271]